MNTPKHASDEEIDTLFELLPEVEHDVFEQRRKNERPEKPTQESRPLTKIEVSHG